MWGAVLVLALITVPDPPRLLATFLVTSRPNPGKNLLFYYVGCLVLNFWFLLVPLTVLHFLPGLGSFLQRYAPPPAADGSSTLQPIPLAIGVLSLLIAARLAMRIKARPSEAVVPAPDTEATPDGDPEPKTPNAISAALSRLVTVEEEASGAGAEIRRLLARIYRAWKEGSVWISLAMGLTYSPLQATAALAIIATSGAPILAQLSAAASFVVIMLAIIELILIGYFIARSRTEALLQSAHGWTQNHNLEVFATISAVSGAFLFAKGLGFF